MVLAAIVLLIVIGPGWLVWWSLILIVLIVPITNALLVGRTHREETTIEKDI